MHPDWERELAFIARLLSPEWNCVQAGAHLGVFPIAFAKQTRKVFCAEPQEEAFEVLLENIRLNQCTNIEAIHGAFGRESGRILCPYVEVGRTDVGLRCGEQDGYWVPLVKIDDIVGDTKIHFIQLDVEGMELEALEGAWKTIERDRPLLYIEANAPRREILSYCNSINYGLGETLNNNVVLVPCPE